MQRRIGGYGSSTSYQRERLFRDKIGFDMLRAEDNDEKDREASCTYLCVYVVAGTASSARADLAQGHVAAFRMQSCHM